MWWSGLPGIDAPEIADGKTDRVIALACALRAKTIDPHDGGSEFDVINVGSPCAWPANGSPRKPARGI